MDLDQLKTFCGTRHSIDKPFFLDGMTLATDGCILVAIPSDPIQPDNYPFNSKAAHEILNAHHKKYPSSLPAEIPKIVGPTKCDHCRGTGKCTCTECLEDHDVECSHCVGGSWDEEPIAVKFGEQKLSHLYLNKIKDLPGLQLFQSENALGPVIFTFQGGRGSLMPMRN